VSGVSTPYCLTSSDAQQAVNLAHRGYNLIAPEYYSSDHLTTRNFEIATARCLRRHTAKTFTESVGTLVDLGSGRGMVGTYLGDDLRCKQWLQIDQSAEMLAVRGGDSGITEKIQGDALGTPLNSDIADLVTAFLFDPYNEPGLPREIRRILRPGGRFLGTLPAAEWALTYRRLAGLPRDEACFHLRNGSSVTVPSYVSEKSELQCIFHRAGFAKVRIGAAHLPASTAPISQHIAVVAQHKRIPEHALPLITVIIAE
jgi:SAM-dependent methyltransferase